MKICIDARSPGLRGVLPYTRNLIDGLLKIDQRNKYVIITDPGYGSWERDDVEEIVVPSNNPLHWLVWSNTVLPGLLRKLDVDIYHSFKHVTLYSGSCSKVLTLHGGALLYEFPEFYEWHDLMYWKFSYPMAIRCYDRIITVSHDEKQYFTEKRGFPEDKFRVTHLAADKRFCKITDKEKLHAVSEKYNLPERFVLFVGWVHPTKNVERIVRGYHLAKARLTGSCKLVIVGGDSGSYASKIRSLVEELQISDDVIFTGYIPDDELPLVYNLAELFLFPTNHEAFGIAALEAMACGAPVIVSNKFALPEVVGDAGLLVTPTSVEEIADAVVKVLSSDQTRLEMIERGLKRSRAFSWENCARDTLDVYEELASARGNTSVAC